MLLKREREKKGVFPSPPVHYEKVVSVGKGFGGAKDLTAEGVEPSCL